MHVRTAFERPPNFRLASFGPGKARYLSGPSECALLQIRFKMIGTEPCWKLTVPRKGVPAAISQVLTFIARRMVSITRTLAHSVDSLVRVSRRLVKDRVPPSRRGVPAEAASSMREQIRSIYLPVCGGMKPWPHTLTHWLPTQVLTSRNTPSIITQPRKRSIVQSLLGYRSNRKQLPACGPPQLSLTSHAFYKPQD